MKRKRFKAVKAYAGRYQWYVINTESRAYDIRVKHGGFNTRREAAEYAKHLNGELEDYIR